MYPSVDINATDCTAHSLSARTSISAWAICAQAIGAWDIGA